MKSLMLVPPAQAEALYDAHLDVREDRRLEDRLAHLPWIDDDSVEETPAPANFNERYPVRMKAA